VILDIVLSDGRRLQLSAAQVVVSTEFPSITPAILAVDTNGAVTYAHAAKPQEFKEMLHQYGLDSDLQITKFSPESLKTLTFTD